MAIPTNTYINLHRIVEHVGATCELEVVPNEALPAPPTFGAAFRDAVLFKSPELRLDAEITAGKTSHSRSS